MSTFNLLSGARHGACSVRPPRRTRRLALACEPLETRQLLSISVFPAAIGLGGGSPAGHGRTQHLPHSLGFIGKPHGALAQPDQDRLRCEPDRVRRECRGQRRGSNDRDRRCVFRPEHSIRPGHVRRPVSAWPPHRRSRNSSSRGSGPTTRAGRSRQRSMSNGRTRSRPPQVSTWSKLSPISPTF